jgi:hypothetical protein
LALVVAARLAFGALRPRRDGPRVRWRLSAEAGIPGRFCMNCTDAQVAQTSGADMSAFLEKP